MSGTGPYTVYRVQVFKTGLQAHIDVCPLFLSAHSFLPGRLLEYPVHSVAPNLAQRQVPGKFRHISVTRYMYMYPPPVDKSAHN